jgi:hypothetical protein
VSTIINLNRIRKRTARERAENEASANRIKFGRTKGERERDNMREQSLENTLDQHRIERENQP